MMSDLIDVPDEAVEAAAGRWYEDNFSRPWSSADSLTQDGYRADARIALAAALPVFRAQIEAELLERAARHLERARMQTWNANGRRVSGWTAAAGELRRLARGETNG